MSQFYLQIQIETIYWLNHKAQVLPTYKWNVSLNLGDQLLLLDLVECLLFLSLRWGPMRLTSMKGRNILEVRHFMSLAATTASNSHHQSKCLDKK